MSSHSLSQSPNSSRVAFGFVSGVLTMIYLLQIRKLISKLRSETAKPSRKDEDQTIDSQLAHDQEAMRMRRDERRQTPVLTNWETEL